MCQGVMMLWLYELYGRAVLIFLYGGPMRGRNIWLWYYMLYAKYYTPIVLNASVIVNYKGGIGRLQ